MSMTGAKGPSELSQQSFWHFHSVNIKIFLFILRPNIQTSQHSLMKSVFALISSVEIIFLEKRNDVPLAVGRAANGF